MRYKFRALDAATKKWVYGYYVVLDTGFELVECIWELGAKRARPIDPDTLGQYTGLTDVNGVEIYEGDIVSIKDFSFSNTHQPVELIRTVGTNYGAYVLSEKGMLDVPMTAVSTDNIEVIGNVHQNKHLLKENE